ncbi:1-phosphatidylinositol 4,5-bisphosphate phosphodiesterase classes I and II-like [Macrobrachium nipponense]|uniref:1-phosphatidylinositol 4,5-bisphosphate phosphodiesterase classes I and II-like n=1 Tax=Macrobrachium nipponense TaxID=159736 RepID=UPI0030C7FF00
MRRSLLWLLLAAILDDDENSKHVIEAESLEKLWNYKTVKEKKVELEKNLEKLRKKFEKEQQNLVQQHEKRRSQLQKSYSKLVKKISTKGISSSLEKPFHHSMFSIPAPKPRETGMFSW